MLERPSACAGWIGRRRRAAASGDRPPTTQRKQRPACKGAADLPEHISNRSNTRQLPVAEAADDPLLELVENRFALSQRHNTHLWWEKQQHGFSLSVHCHSCAFLHTPDAAMGGRVGCPCPVRVLIRVRVRVSVRGRARLGGSGLEHVQNVVQERLLLGLLLRSGTRKETQK